ncbi:MAG: TMEM143 family protein [Hyphomicrobiaceae bacterium]
MSMTNGTGKLNGAGHDPAPARPAATHDAVAPLSDEERIAALEEFFSAADQREKFIPVTREALTDRLTQTGAWPPGVAADARRFFSYLNQWRQQSYGAKLLELSRLYEPFSPDSDLLVTRRFSSGERAQLERGLVEGICELLQQANFTRIDPSMVELILTKDSAYGLDLHVDLDAFDELEIWYRGISSSLHQRRSLKKLYLKKEEFDVPIFRRLAIVFKLKSEERRIKELMQKEGLDWRKAERKVRKMRGLVSDLIKTENVYIKLFKNIPRADLEMCFPNTRIKFRLLDKIRLGVSAGGGLGMGVAGTVSKLAVATNPIALAGAVAGLGGIAIRQIISFTNQRNKYMVTMAQNLYSHALADNHGVLSLLAERAAEEDFKEEVLLYALLAKEAVRIDQIKEADEAIERFLGQTFGIDVNFDVLDALKRLQRDGIVTMSSDGVLRTLPPADAMARIDELWDRYLDDLPDIAAVEGYEFDGDFSAVGAVT